MSEGLFLVVAFLVLFVVLPAIIGLAFERVRASRPNVEMLLNADNAGARATLAYYNEVHDSHSG